MAMNPMQKKARTSFLLGMLLTLIVTGIAIVILILQLSKMKQEEAAIVYQDVYVLSQSVESGDNIDGKGTIQKVRSEYVPANAITNANRASYITSTAKAKIALRRGTVLTTDMLNLEEQETTADVRLQEYNMIILPSQLEEGQSIDVRLRLPTGEDYIVISKKIVKQTDAQTIWVEVSESEILTMSNAIVEAYMMEGSLLYATTYVDAGMQTASSPTYVPTDGVRNLMDADPNITVTAINELAKRYTDAAKAERNNHINPAVNAYRDDALSNVETNLAEEIERQKTARQEYVDGLSAR